MKNIMPKARLLLLATFLWSGIAQAQTAQKETTKTKKGWSKKGKYAAIGGATGAATGVVVGKNDSKSAVIGGVVGAGSGYMYGRHKDRKNAKRKGTYKQ